MRFVCKLYVNCIRLMQFVCNLYGNCIRTVCCCCCCCCCCYCYHYCYRCCYCCYRYHCYHHRHILLIAIVRHHRSVSFVVEKSFSASTIFCKACRSFTSGRTPLLQSLKRWQYSWATLASTEASRGGGGGGAGGGTAPMQRLRCKDHATKTVLLKTVIRLCRKPRLPSLRYKDQAAELMLERLRYRAL